MDDNDLVELLEREGVRQLIDASAVLSQHLAESGAAATRSTIDTSLRDLTA